MADATALQSRSHRGHGWNRLQVPGLWTLPVWATVAVDLTLRAERVATWNAPQAAIYAAAVLYVLALVSLMRRLPLHRLEWWGVWAALVLLGLASALVYQGQYQHFAYFGALPNMATADQMLSEPLESWAVARDATRAGHVLLMLGGWALFTAGWWWMLVRHRPQRPVAWWHLGVVGGYMVLATGALYHNAPMGSGNYPPSVNLAFTTARAAGAVLQGGGEYRAMLQSGVREPVPAQPGPMPVNVLVLVNESLGGASAGYLGSPLNTTPRQGAFLARMGERAFVFPWFYANATTTRESVPSLLTGVHPMEPFRKLHRMPLLYHYGEAFAETESFLFTAHAYETNNFRQFLIAPALDLAATLETEGHPVTNNRGMDDRHVADRFLTWLAEQPTQRPFFGILHFNGPHYPYNVPQAAVQWPGTDERTRHANAVRYNDAQIGRVLAGLAAAGLLDTTVILHTADHGEAFGEHGVSGHRRLFYEEIIRVPFWMVLPPALAERHGTALRANQAGPRSNLDVAPTVIDLLGLGAGPALAPVRDALHGRSLLKPPPPEALPILVQNGANTAAVMEGFALVVEELRLLAHPGGSGGHHLEVYDVREDPQQRHNLGPWMRTVLAPHVVAMLTEQPRLLSLIRRDLEQSDVTAVLRQHPLRHSAYPR